MGVFMNFESQIRQYAEVIVRHGLNIQPGQVLNVVGEACHRDLAVLVIEEAYKAGAKFVNLELLDLSAQRIRLLHGRPEDWSYLPEFIKNKFDELTETHAANLRIVGMENPDILSGLNPQGLNSIRMAQYKAAKRFYDDGIGRSEVHWLVAAGAAEGWARRLFPEISGQAAMERLWREILSACRCDKPGALDAWKKHDLRLRGRAAALTCLKLSELRFTGPGTDLVVGLSPKAVFKGGSDIGPYGARFEPNIPTEECFTTPDWRKTEGRVRATRPFLVNGTLIEGLELSFSGGEVADFTAKKGQDVFAEYIKSDPGGIRLGEVALVGIDSPIYQSGIIFEEILFDENAACHIAVGSAYKFCLQGGETMSELELKQFGCNESSVHTDIMISSSEVDVSAKTFDGSSLQIIKNGAWSLDFLSKIPALRD